MKTIKSNDSSYSIYVEPNQKIKTEWHGSEVFVAVSTPEQCGCKHCVFRQDSNLNHYVCERVQCSKFQRSKTTNNYPFNPDFKETAIFFKRTKNTKNVRN